MPAPRPPRRLTPPRFDAVLFDLDGVLTSTATLHAACWKRVFDDVLRTAPVPQRPFDAEDDYVVHVDGRTRTDGVRGFLASRGLPAPANVVHEIADRKQALVDAALARDGVEAFPGSVAWVKWLRERSVMTAVVSSSANCRGVLAAAGIDALFDTTVDGGDVLRLGLRGKPAPDGFLEAARRLDVAPARTVVVEDAMSGVAAGRSGGFGLVIGVARTATPADLLASGADLVVDDLDEMLA